MLLTDNNNLYERKLLSLWNGPIGKLRSRQNFSHITTFEVKWTEFNGN